MKFKINAKLTAFLVSLFVSLILIVFGNKNNYCLRLGLIFLATAMVFFALFNKERTQKMLDELDEEIEKVENDEEIDEEDRIYVIKELYVRSGKLLKRKKSGTILFYLFASFLVLLAIFGTF